MAEPPLPRVRVPHPHVRCDVKILAGSPHVEGSRVPVRRLWTWHRGGASVETLLRRYPNLGPAKILDALAFAYDNQDVVEADLARELTLFEKQGGPGVGARPLAQLAFSFQDEDIGRGEGESESGPNQASPTSQTSPTSPTSQANPQNAPRQASLMLQSPTPLQSSPPNESNAAVEQPPQAAPREKKRARRG